MNTVVITANF